jgi:acyl dehydratase
MSESRVMTEQVRALIGRTAERVPASPAWGIEREGLRLFCNAIMDPDPRYWDDDFARGTKFRGVVAPPIYCSYLARKTPAGADDPITRAFAEDPQSDGVGGVRERVPGELPPVPTALKRILNGGNEIELLQYPMLGDRIFSQARYADIREHATKDGSPMLVITTETTYTNQDGDVLCVLRASTIRR